MPLAPKAALLFNKISAKLDHGAIGDMTDGIRLYAWCALIALGLSLLFLILICLCTGLITWILLIALVVALISFGVFIIVNLYFTGPLNSGVNAARVKYLYFIMTHKHLMLGIAIGAILFGLVLLFLICKFRKYVSVSIPILKIASKATLKNILLILLSTVIIVI